MGFGDGLNPHLLAALAQYYGAVPGGGGGGGSSGGGGFGFSTDPATIAPLNASAAVGAGASAVVGSPPMRGGSGSMGAPSRAHPPHSGSSGGTGGGPPTTAPRGPTSAKSRIPQPNGANAPHAPDASSRPIAAPPPPPSGAVTGASRGLRAGGTDLRGGDAPPEPPLRGPPSRAGARARNGALPVHGTPGPAEASGAGARSAAPPDSKPTAALDRRGKAVSFG